jgi:hypothetical protein
MIDDAEAAFDQYLKPALSIMKVGKALLPGMSPQAKVNLLNDIYKNYKAISADPSTTIDLANSIRISYSSVNSFSGLNTDAALLMVSQQSRNELAALYGNSAICIAAFPANPSKFAVNLYGVKKSECEAITRRGAGFADAILVNNKANTECESDHLGTARKFYHLISKYGRNQITLIYGK